MTLGQVLQHARVDAQVTQHELSRRTGISQRHLSQLENDKADPSLSCLQRIHAVMPLNITALFPPPPAPAGTGASP